jgi:hypothetical protein
MMEVEKVTERLNVDVKLEWFVIQEGFVTLSHDGIVHFAAML